ncbi:helix-turn-helix domain-containing protein [Vogesella amnigena]|uniref:Helix-turn-helix domain-containing protein n=1 Tax=Vogesella amnigena TaxID=1507449 RepID=A0ABV7TSK7_9NEIS
MQPQDSTLSPAQQVGQQLRSAREARGLSLLDVVDRLKLSPRQLDAIEAGDFDRLPGATFVRGFVRNYARFLELDSGELMSLLDVHYPAVKVEPSVQPQREPQAAAVASGKGGKLWLWLLPLLAAGGVVAWLQGQNGAASSQSEPLAIEASVPLVEASAPAQLASAPVAAAPVVASAPLATASVASAPQAVAPQPASAPVAAEGEKTVQLTARGETWVNVTDAKGKRLIYGLLPAGSSKQVSGQPPFKLVIGNAAQVELAYQGAAVELKDKIRGTTAKLELN